MMADDDDKVLDDLKRALDYLLPLASAVNKAREAILTEPEDAIPTKENVKALRDAEKALSDAIDKETRKAKDDGRKGDVASVGFEVSYEAEHGVYINGLNARAWVRSANETAAAGGGTNYSSSSSSSSLGWP